MESLEGRVLMAFDPSAREQEMLELLNRFRMNPTAELDLLLNANNADIQASLQQFYVDMTALRSQWTALKAVPPVAWNANLYTAARTHNQLMIDKDEQAHDLPGELDLRQRVDNTGYTPDSYIGENVYAMAKSVVHGHAGFAIDWGQSITGIQDPPGHRETMLDTDPEVPIDYREVGISVLDPPPGPRQTGPMYITQEFGAPVSFAKPYVLGTIRMELNGDSFYEAGEGLGGITVQIAGGGHTYTTTTMTAGGYQLRVPPGTYTITAFGGALPSRQVRKNVVVGKDNVKSDFVAPPDHALPTAKLSPVAALTAGGGKGSSFVVTYTDNMLLDAGSIAGGNIQVTSGKGYRAIATLVSKTPSANARSIVAKYKIAAPGGTWDSGDNAKYTIRMLAGQVKDVSGNAVAATTLGTLAVSIPAKRTMRLAQPTFSTTAGVTAFARTGAIEQPTESGIVADPRPEATAVFAAFTSSRQMHTRPCPCP